jgi:hypothetical protein
MASPAALSSDSSQPRYVICTGVNAPLTVSAAGTCSSRQTVVVSQPCTRCGGAASCRTTVPQSISHERDVSPESAARSVTLGTGSSNPLSEPGVPRASGKSSDQAARATLASTARIACCGPACRRRVLNPVAGAVVPLTQLRSDLFSSKVSAARKR